MRTEPASGGQTIRSDRLCVGPMGEMARVFLKDAWRACWSAYRRGCMWVRRVSPGLATRRLWKALRDQNVDEVVRVLARGPDLRTPQRAVAGSESTAWMTPLEYAIFQVPGAVPALLAARDSGISLSEESERRWSPLALACTWGSRSVLDAVLAAGPFRPSDVARAWRELFQNVGFRPVPHPYAAYAAQCLLHRGADLHARFLSGHSVLKLAVRARDESLVRCLLQAGANPRAAEPDGVSAWNAVPSDWVWGQEWAASVRLEEALTRGFPEVPIPSVRCRTRL